MQGIPLSKKGRERLQSELDTLISHKRPSVAKNVEEFRNMGDLSENAPYHAAREELAMIDARVGLLEDMLARGFVVDRARLPKDRVAFGTRVEAENLTTSSSEVYHLVGEGEADPEKGWILTAAPLAQAFIGKKVGETVTVKLPSGSARYTIRKISFIEE